MAEQRTPGITEQAFRAWLDEEFPNGMGSGLGCDWSQDDVLEAFTAGAAWLARQLAAELAMVVTDQAECVTCGQPMTAWVTHIHTGNPAIDERH